MRAPAVANAFANGAMQKKYAHGTDDTRATTPVARRHNSREGEDPIEPGTQRRAVSIISDFFAHLRLRGQLCERERVKVVLLGRDQELLLRDESEAELRIRAEVAQLPRLPHRCSGHVEALRLRR